MHLKANMGQEEMLYPVPLQMQAAAVAQMQAETKAASIAVLLSMMWQPARHAAAAKHLCKRFPHVCTSSPM